jgi:hypothetical protein
VDIKERVVHGNAHQLDGPLKRERERERDRGRKKRERERESGRENIHSRVEAILSR